MMYNLTLIKVSINCILPVQNSHFLTYFSLLICSVEIWDLTSIQKIINVLQERLLFYLQETNKKHEDTYMKILVMACHIQMQKSIKFIYNNLNHNILTE